MKKKLLSMFILLLSTNQIVANPGNYFGKGEPKNSDSSEVVEIKLEMTLDFTDEKLIVDLSGKFEKYSSISITNNRGSEYFFQFVENGTHQHVFNLSELEKGSYFLVLNTNSEIRMKRFIIN